MEERSDHAGKLSDAETRLFQAMFVFDLSLFLSLSVKDQGSGVEVLHWLALVQLQGR